MSVHKSVRGGSILVGNSARVFIFRREPFHALYPRRPPPVQHTTPPSSNVESERWRYHLQHAAGKHTWFTNRLS